MTADTEPPRIAYESLPALPRLARLKGRLGWLRWTVRTFPGRSFTFRGARHRYFAHPYNQTWKNERAVEIPLALERLRAAAGRRVLEVGCVVPHYARVRHPVVDRYEHARGVVNEDVLAFQPAAPCDLILSISTLEHVGWDERPRDPAKAMRAIEHLIGMLAPGGTFFMTVPVGHHPALDEYLRSAAAPFERMGYLKRVSAANDWVEVEAAEAWACAYGRPFPYANAVVIADAHRR